MLIIGLTGSIGMGKSATSDLFRARGIPVHDSDAAVHRLYSGAAIPLILAAFPSVGGHAGIDRQELARLVLDDREALLRLEGIVHPLVLQDRKDFLARLARTGTRMAILDIPLLFETGADRIVDAVVVVSSPESVQKARVMARANMTEDRFLAITARQIPDSEKRRRAHFVIDTGRGVEIASAQVDDFLKAVAPLQAGDPMT